MILKFDGWPRKIIGRFFYATSSFVHHFKAISKFKLEFLHGNAQFRSKLAFFLVPCDLETWWMTSKNNRASFLCYFKPCASFHNHQWIKTRVTVRTWPIWGKSVIFLPCVTLKCDRWPWKTTGHLFYATSSSVHHFIAIGEFKLEVTVRKQPIWVKICNFLLFDPEIYIYIQYFARNWPWYSLRGLHIHITWFSSKTKWYGTLFGNCFDYVQLHC